MKPKRCSECDNYHDISEPHIWFDKDQGDFTILDGQEPSGLEQEDFDSKPTIVHADPDKEKKRQENKLETKKAKNEYIKSWREKNKEAYNMKQREYMRKRRERERLQCPPTSPTTESPPSVKDDPALGSTPNEQPSQDSLETKDQSKNMWKSNLENEIKGQS